jgi:hypothetical protein
MIALDPRYFRAIVWGARSDREIPDTEIANFYFPFFASDLTGRSVLCASVMPNG